MATLEFDDYLDKEVVAGGEPESWEQGCNIVYGSAGKLGSDRHHKYGPKNIEDGKEIGIVQQIKNKLARVENMLRILTAIEVLQEFGEPVPDSLTSQVKSVEDLYDSWGDIINYATYGIILSRKNSDGQTWWRLPMEGSQELSDNSGIYFSEQVTEDELNFDQKLSKAIRETKNISSGQLPLGTTLVSRGAQGE